MSPILGIWASAAQPPLYAGSFESIATASGGTGTITFSNIPQTYTHLQLRMAWQVDADNWAEFVFNSDTTTTNYRMHELRGDGSTANAYSAQRGWFALQGAAASGSIYAVAICDILDYTNTSKNKVARTLNGYDTNGSGQNVSFTSTLWMNTSAITSLSIIRNNPGSQGNYTTASKFALYGIKGA